MKKCSDSYDTAVLIIRDEFHSCQNADDFLITEHDNEKAFDKLKQKQRRKIILKNISDGAVRFKINAAVKHWKKW